MAGSAGTETGLPQMEPACRRWFSREIFIHFLHLFFKGGSINRLIPVFLEGRTSVTASCNEMLEEDRRKVRKYTGRSNPALVS